MPLCKSLLTLVVFLKRKTLIAYREYLLGVIIHVSRNWHSNCTCAGSTTTKKQLNEIKLHLCNSTAWYGCICGTCYGSVTVRVKVFGAEVNRNMSPSL